jgi:6-phosphofructokinase 2
MLVSKEETHRVKAPKVPKRSTVGAGDSMVGGIVWALSQDKSLKEALQWGVACGSAATMNEGTLLFKAQDAKRLFKAIQKTNKKTR